MACTLLVSRENEFEFLAVVDGIEDGENGTTGVANWRLLVSTSPTLADEALAGPLTDVLDALPQHHLVEDLATILADEAVVQLGLAVWL